MKWLVFALFVGTGIPQAGAIPIVVLEGAPLADGSSFTAGTPYYMAFQLTGGGTSDNSALLTTFQFDTGFAWTQSPFDPLAGSFIVGPDASDINGIGQPNASLQLTITSSNAYSLYSQLVTAGHSFGFDVSLSGNYTPPNAPDAFVFQIYDANFTALLYEQTLNIGAAAGAPEPIPAVGMGIGLLGGALLRWRRKGAATR